MFLFSYAYAWLVITFTVVDLYFVIYDSNVKTWAKMTTLIKFKYMTPLHSELNIYMPANLDTW